MSRYTLVFSVCLASICLAALASPAHGGWPPTGAPVCEAVDDQFSPRIVSDDTGGMIVMWADHRNGVDDLLFAQRLDGSGRPVWTVDGIQHCDFLYNPLGLVDLISDGVGGAIVVLIKDSQELWVQRINADGLWLWGDPDSCGVEISNNNVSGVGAVSDGASGVILAWAEGDSVYAQRIDASGIPQWGLFQENLTVFTGPLLNFPVMWGPSITSDGAGGALIAATNTNQLGNPGEIRVQRIIAAGVRAWGLSGSLATRPFALNPVIAGDGVGGGYVVSLEDQGGGPLGIFCERFDPTGQPQFSPISRINLTDNVLNEKVQPDVMVDASGNAVVCWLDDRDGGEIYTQKIDAYGQLLWGPSGAVVSGTNAERPQLLPGGGNSVVVAWSVSASDVFAQRLAPGGSALWQAGGVQVTFPVGPVGFNDWDAASDGAGGLLATARFRPGADDDVFAYATNQLGNTYAAEPGITAVDDVPADQGGWVRLTIDASDRDVFAMTEKPAARYDVWREVQSSSLIAELQRTARAQLPQTALAQMHGAASAGAAAAAAGPAAAGATAADAAATGGAVAVGNTPFIDLAGKRYLSSGPELAVVPPGMWELVGSFSAAQNPSYQFLSPTYNDSSMAGPAQVSFFVSVHTTDPNVWFASEVDSGYSVDNIAPQVPMNFSVAYNTGSGNQLTWDPNPENDLKYYRVYRSETPGFTPGPANYVHGSTTPGWLDTVADGWKYNYQITAVDDADNESGPTGGTATGINGPTLPGVVTLQQNVPNPFNPTTSIRIGVPQAGPVKLLIYDVKGRLVRTLLDGVVPVGFRSVTWQGTDDAGNRVGSGVYFYRLETAGEAINRKMVLLK